MSDIRKMVREIIKEEMINEGAFKGFTPKTQYMVKDYIITTKKFLEKAEEYAQLAVNTMSRDEGMNLKDPITVERNRKAWKQMASIEQEIRDMVKSTTWKELR